MRRMTTVAAAAVPTSIDRPAQTRTRSRCCCSARSSVSAHTRVMLADSSSDRKVSAPSLAPSFQPFEAVEALWQGAVESEALAVAHPKARRQEDCRHSLGQP